LAKIDRANVLWGLGNHDIDYKITDIYSSVAPEIKIDMSHSEMGHYYQLIAANAPKHCLSSVTIPEIPGVVPFSGITVRNEMVFFILNSGLCSARDQTVKHGKLTASQMDWFSAMAKKYKDDSRWKVVLLHHHPSNYPFPSAGLDISTLEEGSSFIDVCGENGINIVSHGHRHHPKAFTEFRSGWANPITFICAGSTSVNSQHREHGRIPNCAHIIKINKSNRDIYLYNYQFDHTEGWVPNKSNCRETPLDAVMFLGSLFTPSDANEAFALLVNHDIEQQQLPPWQELPSQLRSLTLKKLNSIIRTTLSSSHSVYGYYPDQVLISRISK